ncbi:hypothetical protein [Spongiimicrobium salis]|uniref:hypothetical protein n=1 Tax=Spongiimicrobium salis TaxID=1667022 RepID=UPI00374D9F3D
MKEGLIKDAYELIIKEIQTVITISYLVTVAIGMLFNFQKFSEFEINIFHYADVFDFLIAPFADFYILLFAAISISCVWIIFKLDALWKNKRPKSYSKASFGIDKKPWFNIYRTALIMVSFTVYIYVSADYYGKYAKEKVMEQGDISIRMEDNEVKSGKFIGKTKDVLFLWENESVYAIPFTSLVKELKIK